MGCLFCDQAPESIDAREKLAEIGKLVGMASNPVRGVQSVLTELTYEKMANEQIRRDRNQWQHECNELRRYIAYREGDSRMLPEHYTDRASRMRYTPDNWNPIKSSFYADTPAKAPEVPKAPEKLPEEKS